MSCEDKEWDKKLNIDTMGRDGSKEDEYHYPYEPTPYAVLDRLVERGYITKENIVVDYGCGKGRVSFFLNHEIGCKVIGVDFDERMCEAAVANLKKYGLLGADETGSDGAQKIEFVCKGAEKYEIEDADCFYFFNPFSVEILQSVVGKIKKSYYHCPREIQLFFYYPSDEYVSFLMSVPELCFVDEIEYGDLFVGDVSREKILIFEMV